MPSRAMHVHRSPHTLATQRIQQPWRTQAVWHRTHASSTQRKRAPLTPSLTTTLCHHTATTNTTTLTRYASPSMLQTPACCTQALHLTSLDTAPGQRTSMVNNTISAPQRAGVHCRHRLKCAPPAQTATTGTGDQLHAPRRRRRQAAQQPHSRHLLLPSSKHPPTHLPTRLPTRLPSPHTTSATTSPQHLWCGRDTGDAKTRRHALTHAKRCGGGWQRRQRAAVAAAAAAGAHRVAHAASSPPRSPAAGATGGSAQLGSPAASRLLHPSLPLHGRLGAQVWTHGGRGGRRNGGA